MADGSTKPIEEVRNGDRVLATDPETGETRVETVTAEITGEGMKELVTVTVDIDGEEGSGTFDIVATDGHPFWVEDLREWVDATDLRAGQWLRTSAGTYVQITAVERRMAGATVHNLTNIHTYYVLAGVTRSWFTIQVAPVRSTEATLAARTRYLSREVAIWISWSTHPDTQGTLGIFPPPLQSLWRSGAAEMSTRFGALVEWT
nr:polymorphic toxin-type HINT domain-containing protein [Streptomyces sp. ST2-7A]